MGLFETDIGSLFPKADPVETLTAKVSELEEVLTRLMGVVETIMANQRSMVAEQKRFADTLVDHLDALDGDTAGAVPFPGADSDFGLAPKPKRSKS